jgi:hypothetical protein
MLAQTEHVLTFTDAGVDLPQCTGGARPGCETFNDDLVTPDTVEVNPLHKPLTDLIGHRYHADDSLDYAVGVNVQLLF